MQQPDPPTFLDLFAGCGGLTRGFTDAGFSLVMGIDHDRPAMATFAANFGSDRTIWGGVEWFTDVPRADVVVGGPPCQGFSGLGKQNPDDERNQLWREYARIVVASECSIFVLENVGKFSTSKEMKALTDATAPGGALAGFEVEHYLMNSANYATPQKRTRTVLIGSKIGEVGQAAPMNDRLATDGLSPWLTVRDTIDDFDYNPGSEWPTATGEFEGAEIPGPFKRSEIHVDRTYRPLSMMRFRRIPPGGNRFNLPEHLKADCWKRHTTGSGDVMGRLWWDRPSVTIRTEFFKPEKGRYLHPQVHRALTHAEAAALQGFDDRHVWCGTRQQVARQIGNAVPPPLAQAIASQVLTRLRPSNRDGDC